MPKHPCIVCAKNVTSNSIACSVCERWTHAQCSDLDQGVLKYFQTQMEIHGTHNWCCAGCNKAYAAMKKEIKMMEKKQKEMEADLKANIEETAKNTNRIDKVEKDVHDIKSTSKKDKEDIIEQATTQISRELAERGARKDNAVIYGLPELPLSIKAGGERQSKDKQIAGDLFMALKLRVDEEDVKFAARIGKLTEDAESNPRPLKICFRNNRVREELFTKARILPSTRYHEVSIVPDLTDKQRKEDKQLYKEAEKLNAEMSREEAENFMYRCIGRRGERTIAKVRRRTGEGGRASQSRTERTSHLVNRTRSVPTNQDREVVQVPSDKEMDTDAEEDQDSAASKRTRETSEEPSDQDSPGRTKAPSKQKKTRNT